VLQYAHNEVHTYLAPNALLLLLFCDTPCFNSARLEGLTAGVRKAKGTSSVLELAHKI